MKKYYISILTIGLAFFGYSQKVVNPATLAEKKIATELVEGPKAEGTFEKAGGDVLWTGDFTTPSDWIIDNNGQGAGFGWDIGATEQSWYFNSVINSTSDGNFAELNNGNASTSTQALNVIYTLTTAAPIDVNTLSGGANNVILEFQQYGARFNDAQEVYISTDGVAWILAGDNSDIPTLSASGGAAYTNPTIKTINLAGLIPGGTNSLWIRFSWTTAIPSQSTNPNVWITYGWMIDDVRIIQAYDDEFKVSNVFTGDIFNAWDYYSTPMLQTISTMVGVAISNEGGIAQTKAVSVNIDLLGSSVYSGAAPGVMLAPGASDTVWFDTGFIPSAIGLYTVTGSVSADAVLTNNSKAENFEVTNFIYGQNHPLGTSKLSFTNQEEIGIGNIYQINQNQLLKGINIAFATGTTAGIFCDVFVFEMPGGSVQDPANIDVVNFSYQVPASVNTTGYTTIVLPTATLLEAGKIYYAIIRTVQSATEKLMIKSSNKGDADNSTVCYGPFGASAAVNNFVGWGTSPAVSLNFDPILGIEENNSFIAIGSVYPNPTTGETTVDFSLANASNVSLNVVDITGKAIYTVNNGTLTAGAHEVSFDATTFSSGIYYVSISTEESTVTQKFIKK